ncbi:MAG: U32 family peptidase [Methanomicrobiales archaeon]
MKIPELLAPAGSTESLIAAINAGADAVYLGGNRFSARNYAENFDTASIADAVQYAHLRDVRVYVTVNTLVRDSELADTARFILFLYEAGVDAILVQDIGVASIAREITPGLPLHASTQMTIHNREGVAWARELGFSRVVLARELSLVEISEIASSPECQGIGLEIFIHGALCYSYSGQCLLSSMIGGRSGNRGMCAQPCRKPYALVSGQTDMYGRPVSLSRTRWEEEYLLSTKDLCSYRDLDSIVRAPVESLKIEGRMRSPRYVSSVVSVYRQAIDALTLGHWSPLDEEEEELALAFNRGFTSGYLKGAHHGEIMGRGHPDHRGIKVGSVISYHSGARVARVRLSGVSVPRKGDGIVFIDPLNGREYGLLLFGTPSKDGEELQVPVLNAVKPGDILYLTRRKDNAAALKGEKSGLKGKEFSIPLDLTIYWDEELRPVMNGVMPGKDGVLVRYSHTGTPMEIAQKTPLDEDQITLQVSRTGGTPFVVRELVLRYPGGLFAPVSALNQLRRDFLTGAEVAIASSWKPDQAELSIASEKAESYVSSLTLEDNPCPEQSSRQVKISVYASSLNVAIEAIEGGCDQVYFEPETRVKACRCRSLDTCPSGCDPFPEISANIRDLLASVPMHSRKIIWKWPSIPERKFIDMSLDILPELLEKGMRGIMVESPGLAKKVRRLYPQMRAYGGAGLNIFNHGTVRLLLEFFNLTVSPELSLDDISGLSRRFNQDETPGFEIIVQGNLEVLNSRDCIPAGVPVRDVSCSGMKEGTFFGLQDGTGRIFPFIVDPWCHTRIRNSSEVCLLDSIPALMGAGISSLAIDARYRTPAYVKEMIALYREAIRRSCKPSGQEQFTDLLNSVKKVSLGGITSASFRGNLT